MAEYLARLADQELQERLAYIGAVLVEGPKACGKTYTTTRQAATVHRLDDSMTQAMVDFAPEKLFEGPTPILFDEWQIEPDIWNQVRRQVDDRQAKGQFILTGSATPNDDAARHSGAGRFAVMKMRPMSLFESQHSTGETSLAALLDGQKQIGDGRHLGFEDVVQRIVIGGWPGLIGASEREARQWLADYITNVVEVDVQNLGQRRDPRNLRRLVMALGRTVGTPAAAAELARDVGGGDGAVAKVTIAAYLAALERLHLTDNSPAWMPHMRSRTPLREAEVRYFVDPSLGPAALGVGSEGLMKDMQALGAHFEAMVVRDLRIYAERLRGRVDSWRDSNGNEVDAVVSTAAGQWGAFEIKLNPAHADQAAASLLRFKDRVDTSRQGEPSCLAVITGGGIGGRRPDGVHVIPIGSLGP
jgi:predicted AAA+ superfamily ATPase